MARRLLHRTVDEYAHTWGIWYPFFLAALFLRLVLSATPAYSIDMGGYLAWSDHLAQKGPNGLYAAFHIVYAPMYHYLLWLSGLVAHLFDMSRESHTWLIKLWAVAADALGAWLLIRLGRRRGRIKAGFAVGMLYLLNPAVLFDASVWGQFDGIPALLLLAVLLLFEVRRPVPAALVFLLSVLFKPQSGLLLPIVLVVFFRQLWQRNDWKRFLRDGAVTLTAGITLYLAVILPFYTPTSRADTLPRWLDPFWWLFDLYLRSIQDYPYDTANAFNLWFPLGGQIRPDTVVFLGLSHNAWGLLLFGLFALWAIARILRDGGKPDILYSSAWLLLFAAFLFMTKMHERYLVPALLIGAACVLADRRQLAPYLTASGVALANQGVMYKMSFSAQYWLDPGNPFAITCALVLAAAFAWTCRLLIVSRPASAVEPDRQKLIERRIRT